MNRRKGSLALSLLLFMTALLTVSVGFVFYQGRSRESVIRYRKGLASVYAAESGANWALSSLSRGVKEGISFTLNDRTVQVSFSQNGRILSQAEDGNRDYRRYVNITYRKEEKDGKALITVEDIRSEP
jgi:uncharacterized protein (UPF0333 family)